VFLTVHDKHALEVVAVLAVVVATSIRFVNYAHLLRGDSWRTTAPSSVPFGRRSHRAMRFEPRTSDCS